MGIPPQYQEIVALLIKGSRERRVLWKEASEEQFIIAFKEFSFVISSSGSHPEGRMVLVELRDHQGSVIDYFSVDQRNEEYQTLSELYNMALRKARRIDEALEHIARELKGTGIIGTSPPPTKPPPKPPTDPTMKFDENDIPF